MCNNITGVDYNKVKWQLTRERVQSAMSWKALREAITYILDSLELKRNGVRLSRLFAHAATNTWHVVGGVRKPRAGLYSRSGSYLQNGSTDRRLNETGFYLLRMRTTLTTPFLFESLQILPMPLLSPPPPPPPPPRKQCYHRSMTMSGVSISLVLWALHVLVVTSFV